MMESAVYDGIVTHKRLRPIEHKLRYGVFNLFVEVDDLDRTAEHLKLFSHNKFNLLSLHDKDFGDGTGQDLPGYLKDLAEKAGVKSEKLRFFMLAYPRILNFAFNPLTTYYAVERGKIKLMIYEVRNTFGERHTYVIPAGEAEDGVIWQDCAKQFYVSPFNNVEGNYRFHVTKPGEELTLGVALKDADGALLNAFVHGEQKPLTDMQLLKSLGRTGWMTMKVVFGINFEALKLWIKGLRPKPKPDAPKRAIAIFKKPHNVD
ncbi:hypothetical protein MXMO3_01175 [Maritalea myrionectae]|uniref:DUF1365 domain-containing protein n=1 Tax=Maritalea myrionectae TaxID=454601 RepID=A0A2R4MCT7_9HYPH|nr:DUF1365 family protein [Maritalea myrionectae]AVX03706.1 hypothetical protein MXMO3_01175 [Maritalea myrionectae]